MGRSAVANPVLSNSKGRLNTKLNDADASSLEALAIRIESAALTELLGQVTIGRALNDARALLKQNKLFGEWRAARLPWLSMPEAWRRMQVAEQYGDKINTVSHLSFSALTCLSSPSTPPEVREQVEERASKGEKVTAAEIEELKKQLAAAKEEAEKKESQRQDQEHRANLAEGANERLSETVTDLQDEVARLSEEGVIHVAPQPAAIPDEEDDEDDEDEDVDDDVSPRAVAHRAKMAFLVRAGEAERYAFFPPDQKPDRDVLRQAELTMNAWKSLITKLKNGE